MLQGVKTLAMFTEGSIKNFGTKMVGIRLYEQVEKFPLL